MRPSARATIAGSPKFELGVRGEPLGMRCGAEGRARARVGPVRARVGQVPVRLAIPFLGGLHPVGEIGPFELELDPLDLALEELELRCDGVLGPEGMAFGVEGGIACKMEIEVDGTLPGRIARVEFEAEAEEEAP